MKKRKYKQNYSLFTEEITEVFETFVKENGISLPDSMGNHAARHEKIASCIDEAFGIEKYSEKFNVEYLTEDEECRMMDRMFDAFSDILKENGIRRELTEADQRTIGFKIEKILEKWEAYYPPVIFRMYATIEFDRQVRRDYHYINPGDFTMRFGRKVYNFGFCLTETTYDSKKPNILHFEFKDPDFSAFPKLSSLKPDELGKLKEIEEFFVYTGEGDDPEIFPVRLKKLAFYDVHRDVAYDYSDCDFVKKYTF